MPKQASPQWARCKALIEGFSTVSELQALVPIVRYQGAELGTLSYNDASKAIRSAAYDLARNNAGSVRANQTHEYDVIARAICNATDRILPPLSSEAVPYPNAGYQITYPNVTANRAEPVTQEPTLMPVQTKATPSNDVASAAQALALALSASQPLDAEAVRAIVRAELTDIPPTRIEVTRDGVVIGTTEGHVHPEYETLVKAATLRLRDGFHPNIWIAGPPGSGKTHGTSALAKLLGKVYFFNGAVSMSHEVIGFKDAMGALHEVAFTEAFVAPAVYCFDDVDRCPTADPLLALNAALANGHASFARGIVERHPDSVICATANTWGGPSADFASAVKDAALLDRFPVKIYWDYDEKLERALYGSEASDITQTARRAAKQSGLTGYYITPRATAAVAALLSAGFSPEKAKDLTYRATLSPEQRRLIP